MEFLVGAFDKSQLLGSSIILSIDMFKLKYNCLKYRKMYIKRKI